MLASSSWQTNVCDKLDDLTKEPLAKTWLRLVNRLLAERQTAPLLLGEKKDLYDRFFALILEKVLSPNRLSNADILDLIEKSHFGKLPVWELHLILGDVEAPSATGFIDTPVWAHPKAKCLLYQLAEIAYQPPHFISIGQQTSIKAQLMTKIMSIVEDGDYDDTDETRLAIANALFIHDVLKPLEKESTALKTVHQFERLPRQRSLKTAWGGARLMNQEEVDMALPKVSDPSIFFMTTYDRSYAVVNDFRVFMSDALKKLLENSAIKHIFIPFCNHSHWQAAYIHREDKTLTIQLFDPYGAAQAASSLAPEMSRLIDRTLSEEGEQPYSVKMESVSVPYPQRGVKACGYYVVAYAHVLMKQLGLSPVQNSPFDEGYDPEIVESFYKSQSAIERTVIRLHDGRFNSRGHARKTSSSEPGMLSGLGFFHQKSVTTSSLKTDASPKDEMKLSTSHIGRALHLRVTRNHSQDPMLQRADIKAVRKEINRLTSRGCHYFNFGAKTKAERLRRAYQSYLFRLEACEKVSPSMIEDKGVQEAIDMYRYFGCFYRLRERWMGIEKKTSSRCAIEDALSTDALSLNRPE